MSPALHQERPTMAAVTKAVTAEEIPTSRTFAEAARRLDAISDPVRLQIFWWLERGERSVTDLSGLLGMRQQAVTHHLNIVKLKRLVAFRRQGRWNLYRLTDAGREVFAAANMLMR